MVNKFLVKKSSSSRGLFFWSLPVISAVLVVLSLPNFICLSGTGFLGWIALIPLFFFFESHRKIVFSLIAGLVFCCIIIILSQFWLLGFHPLAAVFVVLLSLPEYLLLFAGLHFGTRRFGKGRIFFQSFIWVIFEYLRTLGFLGYPYGALYSSQYAYPIFIQSAEYFGPWFLSFWMVFIQAYIGKKLYQFLTNKAKKINELEFWFLIILSIVMLVGSGFSYFKWLNLEKISIKKSVMIVQPNQDPWVGGSENYQNNLETLENLTTKGIETNLSEPALIVWPETAFVPSVYYHKKYRESQDSYALVIELEQYLNKMNIPIVLGNDHREKNEHSQITDYNVALYWNNGWTGIYKKRKLVPFTEYFPYKKQFPSIYKLLLENDTHFWEPGKEANVLGSDSFIWGTPICYEDAFGEICRPFVKKGAMTLINLTNDSWSGSTVPMRQHFSLAVFRAVENRVPLLRAANGGTSGMVLPSGEVIIGLKEMTSGTWIAQVPTNLKGKTLYTEWGDWFALLAILIILVMISTNFSKRKKKTLQVFDL